MDSKMFAPFSAIEVDTASKFVESVDPNALQTVLRFDEYVENETINKENLGYFWHSRRFNNCVFREVPFSGRQVNNLFLKDCELQQCQAEESNFKSSSFTGSNVSLSGFASSFDYSDFSNATLRQADFTGCSFSDSYFYKTTILNSRFVHSEFVAAFFSKTRLVQTDLSRSNLDFSEFEDVDLSNVTFPYWSTLHVVKGLREIISGHETCFATPSGSHRVSSEQYLDELRLIRAFLYQKKDYFALANLYILDGEMANAYGAVLEGVKYFCEQGLLKPLRYLCRLASMNGFFTSEQLRSLYEAIETSIFTCSLTPVQYKNYTQELDMARRLLIDYPFNQDTISITIQTSIPYTDYPRLSSTLKTLDTMIAEAAPLAVSHIEMRHNSPVELMIQAAGQWGNLLLIFIAVGIVFDKGTTLIERVQNIISNHKKKDKSERVDAELDQLEKKIDELTTAYQRLEANLLEKENTVSLLQPGTEDFERISYLLLSKRELPEELRTCFLSK